MSVAHQTLVTRQFGPHARAYVESADHAVGRDLDHLASVVSKSPGGRILDLGCGGGHVSFTVAPHAREVVAYDLSAEMLAAVAAEAGVRGLAAIQTRQGAAEALPFETGSFDFVFSRFSAHHWTDLAAGLAGIRRVLRPGGLAILMDATGPASARHDTFLQTLELLRDPSHVRDYTLAEWEAALRTAGLRPRPPLTARLPLTFDAWVRRIGTPEVHVAAIRALQSGAPPDVAARFAIEPDGSFLLDTMLIEAEI